LTPTTVDGHEPHPIVHLPSAAVVLDLTATWPEGGPVWSIGRYDEVRGVYTQPLFGGVRSLHVGVDLGGPAGTPVHAWADGVVRYVGVNAAPGDYGPTVVTEHSLDGRPLFVLHGHLSGASLACSPVGRVVRAGDVIGWLGEPHENGGWPPHVHVQLSWEDPLRADMPGVVDPAERDAALARFPDPRRVLGPLW
jgi:murein DD-endopeptidase MepM/ murein hydrolase activator NlpD